MINSVYNSIYEISWRILLLMSNCPKKLLSVDTLLAYDFIIIYGREFGVSKFNLHGNNRYKYSELASRREIIYLSVKNLYLKKLINLDLSDGFNFFISDKGIEYITNIESDYATEYSSIASNAFGKYMDKSDEELLKMIEIKSCLTIEEEV